MINGLIPHYYEGKLTGGDMDKWDKCFAAATVWIQQKLLEVFFKIHGHSFLM